MRKLLISTFLTLFSVTSCFVVPSGRVPRAATGMWMVAEQFSGRFYFTTNPKSLVQMNTAYDEQPHPINAMIKDKTKKRNVEYSINKTKPMPNNDKTTVRVPIYPKEGKKLPAKIRKALVLDESMLHFQNDHTSDAFVSVELS